MNRLLRLIVSFIGAFLTVIMVIWDVIEFLAIPALFVVIGLLNSFPWQYYAISIGSYISLFVIVEIAAHFIFKAFDKKYTPFIERKLEKYLDRFSRKD